jgi:hypothetical protein
VIGSGIHGDDYAAAVICIDLLDVVDIQREEVSIPDHLILFADFDEFPYPAEQRTILLFGIPVETSPVEQRTFSHTDFITVHNDRRAAICEKKCIQHLYKVWICD